MLQSDNDGKFDTSLVKTAAKTAGNIVVGLANAERVESSSPVATCVSFPCLLNLLSLSAQLRVGKGLPLLDLANLKACAAAVDLSTTLLSVDIITSALQVADLDALGIESIVRAREMAGSWVWRYPALFFLLSGVAVPCPFFLSGVAVPCLFFFSLSAPFLPSSSG